MVIFPAEAEKWQPSPAMAPHSLPVLFPARPRLGEDVAGGRNSPRSNPTIAVYSSMLPRVQLNREKEVSAHRAISHLPPLPWLLPKASYLCVYMCIYMYSYTHVCGFTCTCVCLCGDQKLTSDVYPWVSFLCLQRGFLLGQMLPEYTRHAGQWYRIAAPFHLPCTRIRSLNCHAWFSAVSAKTGART